VTDDIIVEAHLKLMKAWLLIAVNSFDKQKVRDIVASDSVSEKSSKKKGKGKKKEEKKDAIDDVSHSIKLMEDAI
jgi:hypothetical protein